MPKLTVEYEINPSGDCNNCKSSYDWITLNLCTAFNDVICFGDELVQCYRCKDFLAKEASKVYCSNCIHLGDYPDWGCNKEQDLDNSLNCKQKETE